MPNPLPHPSTETDSRDLFEQLGCVQSQFVQLSTRLLPVLVLVLTTIAVMLVGVFAKDLKSLGLKPEIGSILVAAGLFFGIVQWRTALEKESLEKYQAEIEEANERKLKWKGVKELMREHYPAGDQSDPREYQKSVYVYLQLDLLEFAVERYLRGFASAYTCSRSLMTFQSKCTSEQFRLRAKDFVKIGSYSQYVQRIVDDLVTRMAA